MKYTALYCCLLGLTILAGCPSIENRLASRDSEPSDGIIRPTHSVRNPNRAADSSDATPAVVRMAQLQNQTQLNRAVDSTGNLESSESELRRIAESNKDPIPLRALRRNEPAPAVDPTPSTPVSPVGSRPTSPTAKPGERLVGGSTMRVNHQILTVDDILEGLHTELADVPNTVVGENFLRRVAAIIRKKMAYDIQQRLVYAEAKLRLEDHVKTYIDTELEKVRREMIAKAGSVQTLRQKCISEGTTLDALLAVQKRAMTVRMYLQSKFAPQIVVNRRALWNYYSAHTQDFSSKKRVQMQLLMVGYDNFLPPAGDEAERDLAKAKSKARAHINKAHAAIQSGTSFTDAVKAFSFGPLKAKGGIWPMMAKGNKAETHVEDAAFAQSVGSISKTIEEASGLFLVKTLATEGGTTTPFEAAQGEIETILREKQYTTLQQAYFQKLYKRAIVQTPQEFIIQAIRRAEEKYRPVAPNVMKSPSGAATERGFKSNW